MEDSMTVVSTKKAAEMVNNWKDAAKGEKILLVIDTPQWEENHPLVLSTKNLSMVRLMRQQNLAVADLLWPNQILVSDKAIEALKLRFETSDASDESDAVVV